MARYKGTLEVREIVALRECGTTVTRIAEIDGTDRITIHHHLRKWDAEHGSKKRTNVKLSDVEAAYCAGVLDGDGCYGMYVNPKHKGPYPSIQLVMTDKDCVTWVANLLQRIPTPRKPGSKTRKRSYALQLGGMTAVNFVREVFPFMHLGRKRKIAKQILRWAAARA